MRNSIFNTKNAQISSSLRGFAVTEIRLNQLIIKYPDNLRLHGEIHFDAKIFNAIEYLVGYLKMSGIAKDALTLLINIDPSLPYGKVIVPFQTESFVGVTQLKVSPIAIQHVILRGNQFEIQFENNIDLSLANFSGILTALGLNMIKDQANSLQAKL